MMYGTEMMAYWSVSHLIVFAIFAALLIYPIGTILRRMGFSPYWSVLVLFPLLNIIGLWIIAMSPWRGSKEP